MALSETNPVEGLSQEDFAALPVIIALYREFILSTGELREQHSYRRLTCKREAELLLMEQINETLKPLTDVGYIEKTIDVT